MPDAVENIQSIVTEHKEANELNLLTISDWDEGKNLSVGKNVDIDRSTGFRVSGDSYRFKPSKESQEDKVKHNDFLGTVSFTLSMPVIFSAAADLMMRNRNFTFTKSTLNLYKKTAVGTCKVTGKAANNYWKKEIKPRAKNAWEGWKKPLDKSANCCKHCKD